MPISFVGAGTLVNGSPASVPPPAGIQEQDCLLLIISSATTISTPSGWTATASQPNTGAQLHIFRKFAGPLESNVSISSGSRTVMLAYRGVSNVDTVSPSVQTSSLTTNQITTNSLTATYGNEFIVSVYGSNIAGGEATWTAPGTTTQRINEPQVGVLHGLLIVDELQSSAGSSTGRTATASVVKNMGAVSFALIPSGRYWVGGTTTWDSTGTGKWAFDSGGASGAPLPTARDTVFFDGNSGTNTVTISTGNTGAKDITCTGFTGTLTGSTAITVSGNVTLVAGMTYTYTGTLTLAGTGTLTSAGKTLGAMTVNGVGITVTLDGETTLSATSTFTLTNGTLSLANNTLSTGLFSSTNSNTRSINFGTGKIVLTSVSAAILWNSGTATGFSVTGTPLVEATGTNGVIKQFVNGNTSGGASSNAFTLKITGSAGNVQLSGHFLDLDSTGYSGAYGIVASGLTVYRNLTIGSGVTLNSLPTIFAGTDSSLLTSAGKLMSSVHVNKTNNSVSLADNLNMSGELLVTQGTFNTANFNLTAANIRSSNSNARTINLGSSTVTLSNITPLTFTTNINLTFNAGTSSIVCNSANAIIIGGQASGTGVTFYNVSFTSSSVSTHEIRSINTFNNLTITGPAGTAGVTQVTFDSRQTINGTLSTIETAGNRRVWFRGVTYGLAQTLTVNATPSLTDADFRDIYVIGTAAPISGTRIGNLRGCSGITFSTPKTVYWNLAGTQNWSSVGWSDTSTGTLSKDNFPLAQDTATFTNAGSVTGTITMDSAIPYTGTVDMSGRTSAMTLSVGTVTIYGDWKNGSGTTLAGSSTLTFSGRNTQIITSAGKTFSGAITIDSYGGTVELADALNMGSNTLTVTNGTFDTKNYTVTAGALSSSNSNVRTINLGSSTLTFSPSAPGINFSDSTNLNFLSGTSVINLNSVTSQLFGGSKSFYDVNFINTNTINARLITGNNTFNNLTFNSSGSASIIRYTLSANQTITGTLNVAGATAVRRVFVFSDTLGTTRTLTVGTLSATDCDFRDITIAGAASGSSPTRAGNCGGNSGITFPAAKTVYWNLAGAQNWSATAWAPGSGGTPDINQFPLAQDTAVFDNTGSVTGTITIDAAWNIGTFDASARTSAMTLTTSTNAPFVYGDWKFGTGVTSSSTTGTINFGKRGTQTITSNGVQFGCPVTVNCVTGTVQLADALSLEATRTLTLTSGTFDAVTYNVTVGVFESSAVTATLKMGTGTWTLSGTGAVWNMATTLLTLYKGTANITLSDTSTTARTFAGNGYSYNKLTIGGTTGTSTLTITGNNQFTELASTKTVAHTIALGTTTQTFGKWTVTGTVGNVVTLTGTGTTHILAGACTNGIDYLAMGSIGFSTGSPGEFYAGANSTGTAGAPVYRTAKPADSTRYWVGGTGNWSDTARWSTGSGGASGAAVPRSHDNVVFDAASNATAYTATVNAVTGGIRMKSLTIAGPLSGNVTLAGTETIIIHDNVLLPATGLTRTYTGFITLSGSVTGRTLTTNGVTLNSLTISGIGCEWILGSALTIDGLNTINLANGALDLSTYNFVAGGVNGNFGREFTFKLGSGTHTLSSTPPIDFGTNEQLRTDLTVVPGTSNIICSRAGAVTFNGNNQTFYNVDFTSTSTGTVTINGANIFNNLSFTGITATGLKTILLSANQTVTGTLTFSPGTNATMRQFCQSNTIGTARTITAATVSMTDVDFRDITIAGAASPASGTRIGDIKGNSGITFTVATTKYWNLANGGNWTSTAWATERGGAVADNNFPLPQDTVYFSTTGLNNNSTVTINISNIYIANVDLSERTSSFPATINQGISNPFYILGNLILGTGTTFSSTGGGSVYFTGGSNHDLVSAGRTLSPGTAIGPTTSDTLNLLDSASFSGVNFQGNCTINTNSYNVTISGTVSGVSDGGNWNIGNSVITMTGSSFTFYGSTISQASNGTLQLTNSGTKLLKTTGHPNVTLSNTNGGTITFELGVNGRWLAWSDSTTTASTFNLQTTTQTVSFFIAAGESGRPLALTGFSSTAAGTLIYLGTQAVSDYLAVTGIRAYPLNNTWYAGTNSTNNGSLGVNYTAAPALINRTYLLIL